MNYENFPEAEKSTETVVKKSNSGRNVLTAALVILLLGTWGYIIYDKNNTREVTEGLTTQIVNSDSARNELQRELDDAALRLDALKTSNVKADSLLKTKDKDIEEIRGRVQKILNDKNATTEQLAEAKRLVAQLKGNIETYVAEIESLKAENVQLTEEKRIVIQQRDVVQRGLDSTVDVVREKEDVIDVGSTLHASNFSIIGTGLQRRWNR